MDAAPPPLGLMHARLRLRLHARQPPPLGLTRARLRPSPHARLLSTSRSRSPLDLLRARSRSLPLPPIQLTGVIVDSRQDQPEKPRESQFVGYEKILQIEFMKEFNGLCLQRPLAIGWDAEGAPEARKLEHPEQGHLARGVVSTDLSRASTCAVPSESACAVRAASRSNGAARWTAPHIATLPSCGGRSRRKRTRYGKRRGGNGPSQGAVFTDRAAMRT
jgi:hypothetical protein